MKKTLIALGIFCLMGMLVYAADNYESWCATITEIYGVCSPELVANWLAHQAGNVPSTVTSVESQQETSITNTITDIIPNETLETNTVYCWYMIDGTKKCRLNRMYWTEDKLESKCNGSFNLQGKELCDLTK